MAELTDKAGDTPDELPELVYRRIQPGKPPFDHGLGKFQPPSKEFKASDRDRGMSVWIDSIIRQHSETPQSLMARDYPNYKLVSLTPEELGQHKLKLSPEPTDKEPWHANVYGLPEDYIKLDEVQSALQEKAKWVVPTQERLLLDEFQERWNKAHASTNPNKQLMESLATWLEAVKIPQVEQRRKEVKDELDAAKAAAEARKAARLNPPKPEKPREG